MEKLPIQFQPFNERSEVRIYHHGSLPHWRQDGCTYFVTFRLADALPKSVVLELKQKRMQWLEAHGIDPLRDQWRNDLAMLPECDRCEFERMMASELNRELDAGYGSCILREPEISQIIADALDFHHGERALTGDFAVMPNHVHALITPVIPHQLEAVMKSIKSFTAGRINRTTGTQGKLWQRDSYDHIVRDSKELRALQKYIHDNPTKAGIKAGSYRLAEAEYELT